MKTLRMILELVGGFSYSNPGLVLCIILSLIEVSTIKINPWSWLVRQIGGIFFSRIEGKVDSISKAQDEMRDEMRQNEAIAARARILCFGDEIYRGVHHSKEYFDHILTDISKYNAYCSQHPEFQNEITVMTVKNIKRVYEECLEKHSFL